MIFHRAKLYDKEMFMVFDFGIHMQVLYNITSRL